MKDKSWIIIVIMAIALIISVGYSIYISNKNSQLEKTAATTSIIEMTATTVTIKNTLTGTGIVEYREVEVEEGTDIESIDEENTEDDSSDEVYSNETVSTDEDNNEEENSEESIEKEYQMSISIEDKDLEKVEVGQDVEISIVNDDETNLTYTGEVTEVNELSSNKSTLNVEITNADDKIEEGMAATCTVIIEKAENVVALPIEAIQVNEERETYVNVVQEDETTKQVIIETGISDNYYVEITSGLVAGDRVQIVKTADSPNDSKNQNETNNSIANVINSII